MNGASVKKKKYFITIISRFFFVVKCLENIHELCLISHFFDHLLTQFKKGNFNKNRKIKEA